MTRIKAFVPDTVAISRPHPTTVDCGYSIVQGDGEKLLQLNTYGSEGRANPGKMSQTLQLDRERAHELVRLIEDTFGARSQPTRLSLGTPDMRSYLTSLVGTSIQTLTGAPNEILRIETDHVIVGTKRSPAGQPVPIAEVQEAADRLYRDGALDINPESVGYRSAFVGAVLCSLPGAVSSSDRTESA